MGGVGRRQNYSKALDRPTSSGVREMGQQQSLGRRAFNLSSHANDVNITFSVRRSNAHTIGDKTGLQPRRTGMRLQLSFCP